MKVLTDPTSKGYKIFAKIVDLYFLNMLFIGTSGFGLLLGPAFIATFAITHQEMGGSETNRVRRYLKEYKANFKRGILLEGILMILVGSILISYRCTMSLQGISMFLSLAGLFLLTILTFIWSILIFPYTAHYQNTLFQTFKVCFQVAVLNTKKIIYIFAILIFIWLIGSINNFFFALLFFFGFLVGFSGWSYINALLIYPIFRQYES